MAESLNTFAVIECYATEENIFISIRIEILSSSSNLTILCSHYVDICKDVS